MSTPNPMASIINTRIKLLPSSIEIPEQQAPHLALPLDPCPSEIAIRNNQLRRSWHQDVTQMRIDTQQVANMTSTASTCIRMGRSWTLPATSSTRMVMMNLEATTTKTTSIIVVRHHPTKSHVISSNTTSKVKAVTPTTTEMNRPQILTRGIGKILGVVEANNTINIVSPEQRMNTSLCLPENILLLDKTTNLE